MTTYEHLLPQVYPLMDKPETERIDFIRKERWIGYVRAREILDLMDDLLIYPQRHRMPNLLIVGDTNNGKTMILRRFLELHPSDLNLDGDAARIPVLLIQAPPIPDEARLYRTILDKLFAPYRSVERVDRLLSQVLVLLKRVGVKILIIDEFQHILAGNQIKQRQFLNVIKYLGNELMIPIVASGIQDAMVVLRSDPQLSNRFRSTLLPRWQMDNNFLRLLASFEKALPLKYASNLPDKEIAIKILAMSEGLIGEMSTLLTEAATIAVRTKHEKIDISLLNRINWTSPSERRRTGEKSR